MSSNCFVEWRSRSEGGSAHEGGATFVGQEGMHRCDSVHAPADGSCSPGDVQREKPSARRNSKTAQKKRSKTAPVAHLVACVDVDQLSDVAIQAVLAQIGPEEVLPAVDDRLLNCPPGAEAASREACSPGGQLPPTPSEVVLDRQFTRSFHFLSTEAINAIDKYGNSVLMEIASGGEAFALQVLERSDLSEKMLNTQTAEGRTCFSRAVEMRFGNVCLALLQNPKFKLETVLVVYARARANGWAYAKSMNLTKLLEPAFRKKETSYFASMPKGFAKLPQP